MAAPGGLSMSTPRWYAIATKPRHEKVVNEQLQLGSIDCFLPVIKTISRWKDRRVAIERPIFPGYVFTRIDLLERTRLYTVPGILRIVSFNGKPAPIDDSEIEGVRLCLTRGRSPTPYPFPALGDRVCVVSGALQGLRGVVVRNKKQYRIVVSVHLIHQSVSVEIDANLLEPDDGSRIIGCEYETEEARL
jgi:transcriptional antiterminator NusG